MNNNILVIDLTFYPASDANTICALRILKNQLNYNITVVCEKRCKEDMRFEEYEGLLIYRISINSFRRELKNINSLKDFITFIGHSGNYISAKVKKKRNYNDINFDRINNYLREIENIVAISNYDIILSFANPIESHYCASKLSKKHKKPWIAYYFDPYYCNASKSSKGLRQRVNLEKKMLIYANKVIVPGFFENEMLKHGIINCRERLQQIELPGIRRIEKNDIGYSKLLIDDRIKCVFIGNLYWKIRNPIKVMQAFEKLNKNIALYFVGGCFDGDIVEKLRENHINIPKNIFFIGKVAPEIAEKYLNQADILVNIGNTVNNQLPSKVFDYISIGKPIINIYKIKDCPSLKYFNEYPLAINIYEEDLKKEECIGELQNFCLLNKGKCLQYSEIKSLYEQTTVEYVRKQLVEQIEIVLKNCKK